MPSFGLKTPSNFYVIGLYDFDENGNVYSKYKDCDVVIQKEKNTTQYNSIEVKKICELETAKIFTLYYATICIYFKQPYNWLNDNTFEKIIEIVSNVDDTMGNSKKIFYFGELLEYIDVNETHKREGIRNEMKKCKLEIKNRRLHNKLFNIKKVKPTKTIKRIC